MPERPYAGALAVLCVALAVVGAVVPSPGTGVSPIVRETFGGSQTSQRELVHFLSTLHGGLTKTTVRRRFDEGRYRKLRLEDYDDKHETGLMVRTPLRLGARNWIAYLPLDQAGVVSAVRVRTFDDATERPDEAPADRLLTVR